MGTQRVVSRRGFLVGSAAAAAAPYIVASTVLGRDGGTAPSERIGVGVIGTGGRGGDHMRTALGYKDVQVLAVCDAQQARIDGGKKAVEAHYARAGGEYKGCGAYLDYRQLLARSDIDAVFIASPENWHPLHSVAAVAAGKDVYCEKALAVTVAEGRAVVDAVRRYGRVWHFGTQQRSWNIFRFSCELVRSGYIGQLKSVTVSVPGGHVLPNAPAKPVPPGLDYELWLGPAPWTPYNDLKCSYNWYFMTDYCRGWIQSWGVHYVDVAMWGCPSLARKTVTVDGSATFPADGIGNASYRWNCNYLTHDGVQMKFVDDSQGRHGVLFEGDKGSVFVNRGGMSTTPGSLMKTVLRPEDVHLYEANDHHEIFFRCVRTRKDTSSPVEEAQAANTLTLIGDIATRLNRKLTWDWQAERFVNDEQANRMLSRPMRTPWVL